jgi:restriction endonuclease Mrr
MTESSLPTTKNLILAVLRTAKKYSDGISSKELDIQVIGTLGLTEEQLGRLHKSDGSKRTEIQYRLAWARTNAKRHGYLTCEGDKKWRITELGMQQN